MSSPASTFQCYRCAGFFRAAAEASARVKCPHCAWVARAGEFRRVREDEVGTTSAPGDQPADASVEVAGGAWLQKGKLIQFGCPHCERPMRMRVDEAGGLTDCPHCGVEIVSPDPDAGTAAKLSAASARNLSGAAGRTALKPREFRERSPEIPTDQAPSLAEADESLAAVGDEGANPFSASAAAAGAVDSAPHRGVKVLGVEQLGAAFQAKADVDVPNPVSWDSHDISEREDRVFNDRRGKWFGMVAGFLLAVFGTLFVVLEAKRRGETGRAVSEGAAVLEAERDSAEARYDRAFAVAQQVAGASTWREVLPFVRSRERVEPLMEAYYADREFESVALERRGSALELEPSGFQYVQLTVFDTRGRERLVGLHEVDDGTFLFDWELWVDIASWQWSRFLDTRPTGPTPLRVTLARSSPLPRYIADAGLDESAEKPRALRVWLNDSAATLYAVFPETDAAMMEIWESLDWDHGRRVVVELAFPERAGQADVVKIGRIVQARWLMP